MDRSEQRIAKFEGNPVHPGSRGRTCAKGPATLNQIHDPERILVPLKRKGKRGSGEFEEVSWEAALDDIGARIARAIGEGRNEEVMYHVGRPGEDHFAPARVTGRAPRGRPPAMTSVRLAPVGAIWTIWGIGVLACRAEPPPPARGVVLVVLDTLRADRLGCHGYARRPTSPRLDALAARAVLFEQAISHAPWTVASFASILSGFPDTRAFDGELRRSLVEDLAAAGVRTAALTEGGYVTAQFGFDRGFGEFTEDHYLSGGDVERTVDAALAWLAEPGAAPFFLLVHSYEAHMPYVHTTFTGGEPPRFGERFTQEAHEAVKAGELVLSEEELAWLEALYDGGVAACDRGVGRLLDGLAELGLAEEVVVIVTSDHGEELAEGRFPRYAGEHGHALTEELVHVPLIVVDPRRPPRRVAAQVRSMDVLPTVLELLGVRVPPDVEGRSLVPLLDGRGEPGERLASGGSPAEGPDRAFVRSGGRKLVRRLGEPEPGSPFEHVPELELFDLGADPLERTNLAGARPELVHGLCAALARVRSGRRVEKDALEVPAALAEELEALGY